jgi:hypothetical protein
MALALGSSGPPGVTEWHDDRTVMVIAVYDDPGSGTMAPPVGRVL